MLPGGSELSKECGKPFGCGLSLAGSEPRESGLAELKQLVGTLGILAGEPATAARRQLASSVLEHLDENPTGASSHEEAFAVFEADNPHWRLRVATAPPHVAPGAHAIGVSASDWASAGQRGRRRHDGRRQPRIAVSERGGGGERGVSSGARSERQVCGDRR